MPTPILCSNTFFTTTSLTCYDIKNNFVSALSPFTIIPTLLFHANIWLFYTDGACPLDKDEDAEEEEEEEEDGFCRRCATFMTSSTMVTRWSTCSNKVHQYCEESSIHGRIAGAPFISMRDKQRTTQHLALSVWQSLSIRLFNQLRTFLLCRHLRFRFTFASTNASIASEA